jgi:uncharacterized RDD family membrane protein YckC
VEFWDDYEVLTVETPENIELKLPLAGFGPRFLALFVDSLLQGALALVLIIVLIMVLATARAGGPGLSFFTLLLMMIVGVVMVTLGYFVVFEWIWNGQTPGKRLTGIRVVKRGGMPLSPRDVLLRNLVRLLDYFPSYGLVGMVTFFGSANQQRVGDLVADTVVIREFTRQLPYTWVAHAEATAGGAGTLTPQLSYVIGSYLSRSAQLPTEVRLDLTERIISALGHDARMMLLRERDDYLASVLNWAAGERR